MSLGYERPTFDEAKKVQRSFISVASDEASWFHVTS